MGYSASIACKSRKMQAEILRFMRKHSRSSKQAGLSRHAYNNGLHEACLLKYARMDLGLGYDSPHELDMALLRWMAVRVGKRRSFQGYGIERPVPWVNCDDDRSEPVLVRSEWPDPTEGQEQYLVDDDGYRPLYDHGDDEIRRLTAPMNIIIEAELRRLSGLWSSR